MRNKYSLFNYDQDSDNPDLTLRDEATKEIDKLIWKFREEYLALEDKYNCGIGDTETDECVAHHFYDIVHFGSLKNKPDYIE